MATRITQTVLEVLITPEEITGVPVPDVSLVTAHDCAALKNYYHPRVALMANGQPGMLLRAQPSPYGGTANRVYFVRFNSESRVTEPVLELFTYDTFILGLVQYKGTLYAMAQAADQTLKVRTSIDNGVTWQAEVDLPTGLPPRSFVPGGGTQAPRSAISFVTNRDGTAMYVFFLHAEWAAGTNKSLMYRTTSGATLFSGWSGSDLDSGYDVFSVGRNYGGVTARNQADTIAFSGPIETKTDGQWVIGAETDDGDWHANHGVSKGTLGGAWALKYNDGFGGGLSGYQGSNGAMMYDFNGDIIMTNMEDDGNIAYARHSADNGETWWQVGEQMPVGTGAGIGQHTGLYIPLWDRVYLFSGLAGLEPMTVEKTDLYATRVTLDLVNMPRKFTDVLGEAGLYLCTPPESECSPYDVEARLPLALVSEGRLTGLALTAFETADGQAITSAPRGSSAMTSAPAKGGAQKSKR